MLALNKKSKSYSFDMIFAAMLFCFFTVISLLLVGVGSSVYRNTQAAFEEDYVLRTALSYVSGKIRYNSVSSCSTDIIGETEVLIFSETVDNRDYETLIYYFDGALCEQYILAENNVSLSNGTKIVEPDSFTFELSKEGVLHLNVTASDKHRELNLCVNRFSEVTP